jgi:hypothetical protein
MTKKEFCKTIVDTIDNMNYIGETDKDKQTEAVMALISPLKPKDLKRFAKWGQPEQQTTPEKCWD